MAKGSGKASGKSSKTPPYSGSTSDPFYRKVNRAYRDEYIINKGRSSLTDSEIERAVALGILDKRPNNEYYMRS